MHTRLAWALALAAALWACDDGEAPSPTPTPDMAAVTPDMRAPDMTPEPDLGRADMTPADLGPDAAPPDMGCACPGQQTCDDQGRCVEPGACEGDVDCTGERACVDGACTDRCMTDVDCTGEGERCDPQTRLCTTTTDCQRDLDCGEGVCVDGLCAPRCMANTCPGQQRCDAATGRCVEADGPCDADADCLGDRICQDGACVSPCAEAADCAGAQACEGGRCVEPAECSADLDCLQARVCAGGACQDPCGLAGCPGGLACDDESGRCGEASPCQDDAGCFDGRRCDDGACVDPCREAADCAGAQRCTDGRCAEPERCADVVDCLGDRICGADGACADRCGAGDCPGQQACDALSGSCVEAQPCVGDAGCFVGRVCEDGACIDPCQEAADCPGAMRCEDGRCQEPPRCSSALDCLGDRRCVAGLCLDACVQGQCPGARACVNGACAEGDRCAAEGDCDPDRVCSQAVGACVDRCPQGECPPGLVCGEDALCGEPEVCAADLECLGGRACRLARCVQVACEAHAACDDQRCVEFACADAVAANCPAGWAPVGSRCEAPGPCAQDADCPGVCGADGLCARCRADADCPGAQRCLEGACADAIDCADNADCVPGHVCNGGACAVGACDEDRLAGNHTPADALALAQVDLLDLRACEARADWFQVGGDDGVTVVARYNVALPPLQLALRRADAPGADPVDVSVAAPGEAWVSAGPGDYLLEVRAAVGGSGTYRLQVDPGPACADDRFDRPWRNDAEASARAVQPGVLRGTLCPGDEDWFRVEGPGRVQVAVQGAQATANGQPAPATVDGPAVIRVTGEGAYTLTTALSADPAAACAAAPALALGAPVEAPVAAGPDRFAPACRGPGNPDRVFRLDVPQAGQLTVELVDPDPTAGLMLYTDCGAAPVACTAPASARIEQAVQAGPHFVVVDGPYAGRIQATLDAGDAPAACAAPAALLPGQPAQVPLGGPAGVPGACLDPAAGAAAFTFDVPQASQVELALTGGGPMSALSLRGACADPASELQCEAAFEPFIVQRLEAGRYVAVAQGGGQLSLTVTPDQAPLFFEDMCFPGGARPVFAAGDQRQLMGDTTPAGDSFSAVGCGAAAGGPDQVVQFDVQAPVRLRATAQSDAFAPVLSLTANDCFGEPVCGAGAGLNVVLQPGDYGLVVDADGPGRGAYTVDLRFEAP